MVFHFFIFTISISKRRFSGSDIERAYRAQRNEQIVQETKQRCLLPERFI